MIPQPVSVLIPTRGTSPYLMAALASVQRQTVRPLEIVVDYSVVTSVFTKLNRMIEKSGGDWFIVLSDDDKIDARFLEKTLRAASKYEDDNNAPPDIVYTDLQGFGNGKDYVGAGKTWSRENIQEDTVPWFTSLVRKSAWDRAGGYDSDVGPYGDWEFYLRCFYSGCDAICVHEPLFHYRHHSDQDTNKLDHADARQKVLVKHGLA